MCVKGVLLRLGGTPFRTLSPVSTLKTLTSPVLLPAAMCFPSLGDNAIVYALTGPASMSCVDRVHVA